VPLLGFLQALGARYGPGCQLGMNPCKSARAASGRRNCGLHRGTLRYESVLCLETAWGVVGPACAKRGARRREATGGLPPGGRRGGMEKRVREAADAARLPSRARARVRGVPAGGIGGIGRGGDSTVAEGIAGCHRAALAVRLLFVVVLIHVVTTDRVSVDASALPSTASATAASTNASTAINHLAGVAAPFPPVPGTQFACQPRPPCLLNGRQSPARASLPKPSRAVMKPPSHLAPARYQAAQLLWTSRAAPAPPPAAVRVWPISLVRACRSG